MLTYYLNLHPILSKFSPELLAKISEFSKIRKFPKRRNLVVSGDFADEIHIVTNGLLRCYYINHEGKENTLSFLGKDSILAKDPDLSALLSSEIVIDFIEDTELMSFKKSFLNSLFAEFQRFLKFGKLFMFMKIIY